MSAFNRDDERALALRAIAGSPGWFERVQRSAISKAMTSDGPARDWVAPVLLAAVEFATEQVAALIQEHWLPTEADDYRAWSVLQQAPVFNSHMLEMGVTILGRSQVAPIYLDQIAGSLGVEQPRTALLLIRAALDRSLNAAADEARKIAAERPPEGGEPAELNFWGMRHDARRPVKDLLDNSNDWDLLRALAERAPADTIDVLWPWFLEALAVLDELQNDTRDRPLYALQYEADFRFEGENGLDLPEPSLLSVLRIAIEKLAATSPDAFRIWMAEAVEAEFQPVHRLIAHVLRTDPQTFADDSHVYLLADERRWSLGHLEDHSATTTSLVTAAAPYWSAGQVAEYERRVRSYSPPVPQDLDQPEGRRAWGRIQRDQRLCLLRALPSKQRTRETAELVRTEERAIGNGRRGITFSGVYSPSSIMSAVEMDRAKDDDIINAFRSLPDATRWDHPKHHRKGGNIQLSREFAIFAKGNPERAIRLISRFEPEFGERAAGNAIAEMAAVTDPEALQALIVGLANRGFTRPEFRSSVATAVETLLSAKASLNFRLVETLLAWLLNAAAENDDPGEGGDNPDDLDVAAAVEASADDDPEGRSLLWGHGGYSVVPGDPFPVLHALVRHYIVLKDQEALRGLLSACLQRGFETKIWVIYFPFSDT